MMDAMKDALKQRRANGVSITLTVNKDEGGEPSISVDEQSKDSDLAPGKAPQEMGMEQDVVSEKPADQDLMGMLESVPGPLAKKAKENLKNMSKKGQ